MGFKATLLMYCFSLHVTLASPGHARSIRTVRPRCPSVPLSCIHCDLQTKANMADNDFITDDIAGSAYISNFASKVFEGADETDRSGKATR